MAAFFESLGINLYSFLYHLAVILVLVLVLWRFLYKPIKKIIKANREKVSSVFEENRKLQKQSDEIIAGQEEAKKQLEQDAITLSQEVTKKAEAKSEAIILDAQEKAKNILETANKNAKAEQLRQQNDFNKAITDLSIEIASKILEREVKSKDNQKIIDECVDNWSQTL